LSGRGRFSTVGASPKKKEFIMSERAFKFPIALLITQAGKINAALTDATVGPPVAARLPTGFATAFSTLVTKVGGGPAGKALQAGATAILTKEQNGALVEMLRLMSGARRTASLAFRGNDPLLHEAFQVGEHEPQGLDEEVKRAKIILASLGTYAAQLGAEGWTTAETTALSGAIGTLTGADLDQENSKSQGPGITSVNTTDANTLYRNCLTIQNAARLQFPSTQPGNETPRARYLIGAFPPHGHSSSGDIPPDKGAPPPAK
jgi:hypothetical protein